MAFYDSLSRYRLDETNKYAFRQPLSTVSYRAYTVREGDTMETLARRIFGNPQRYWEIADLNPQLKFPLGLSVGDVIRLPA